MLPRDPDGTRHASRRPPPAERACVLCPVSITARRAPALPRGSLAESLQQGSINPSPPHGRGAAPTPQCPEQPVPWTWFPSPPVLEKPQGSSTASAFTVVTETQSVFSGKRLNLEIGVWDSASFLCIPAPLRSLSLPALTLEALNQGQVAPPRKCPFWGVGGVVAKPALLVPARRGQTRSVYCSRKQSQLPHLSSVQLSSRSS